MIDDSLRKKVVTFAKKNVSPRTGFLHLQDTIPILENFLYAYALFRMKTIESVQEGKALLEKLLPFEVHGNFPVYLHEFPHCKDSRLSSYILAPLFYLLRDFSPVLGEKWTEQLTLLGKRIVSFLEKDPTLSKGAKGRLDAFCHRFDPSFWHPESLEEWGEFCVCCQMAGVDFPYKEPLWNSVNGVFLGKVKDRVQEEYEPEKTLLHLMMDPYFKNIAEDHPLYFKASLVHPWTKKAPEVSLDPFVFFIEEKKRQPFTFYWKDQDRTHSLVLESKKGSWSCSGSVENGWVFTYSYDNDLPSEEDSVEWALYLSDFFKHTVYVDGKKSTMFLPGQQVKICSSHLIVSFSIEAEGSYTGHVLKGDRLFQKGTSLPYGGYDKKLAWRTIQRDPKVDLKIYLKCEKAGL